MSREKTVVEENDEQIVTEVEDESGVIQKTVKKKELCLKQYEIVCDEDKLQVDLQAVFMKYQTIKQWAYILHDKDNTRPHYHIYINFGSASVKASKIAEWFKVPMNFIEKVHGRKTDMLRYLTHSTDDAQYKHQYKPEEIISNFDVQDEIKLDMVLGDFDKHTYAEQIVYIDGLKSKAKKVTAFRLLDKLWNLHCKRKVQETDRQLQVVFITGKGGTGKTTYAKALLQQLGYDYMISSSSNDPFQDYLGQNGIILDDLRDKTFALDDLLKILDNNTKSSIKSRFANKVFNGKMIIITSSIPLDKWYPKLKSSNQPESLYQLYRRINDYVEVKTDVINIYDHIDSEGKPYHLVSTYKNELIKLIKKEPVKKENISGAFGLISKACQERIMKVKENA